MDIKMNDIIKKVQEEDSRIIGNQIENMKMIDDDNDNSSVFLCCDDDEEYISPYILGQKDIHYVLPIQIIQNIFYYSLIDNGNSESVLRVWDSLNQDRLNLELVCKDWCSILKSTCKSLSLSINNLKFISSDKETIKTFTLLKKLEIIALNHDSSDDEYNSSDDETDEYNSSDESENEQIRVRFKNSAEIKEINNNSEDEALNRRISNRPSDLVIRYLPNILEAQHKTLRVLDLSMLALKEYHIEKLVPLLSNHKYIEELILDSNPIRDQGIIFVSDILKSENNNLKILDLQSSKSKNGLEYIGNAIGQNKILEKLIWSYNESSYGSIVFLSNGLRINSTLNTLVLKGCKIEGWGAYSLSETLGINKTLRELDLSMNEFGDRGGCSIAEKLNSHPALTILDLSCNLLSTQAFNSIFQSLESNKTLTSLNLSKNQIDSSISMDSIFFTLSHNSSLTSLNLSDCLLQNTHFDLICQGLINNKSLLKLDLSRNSISNIVPFLSVLQKNKSLKSINISRHKIKSGDLNILLHCLIKKKSIECKFDPKSIQHQIEFINLSIPPDPLSKDIHNLLKEYRSIKAFPFATIQSVFNLTSINPESTNSGYLATVQVASTQKHRIMFKCYRERNGLILKD